MEGNWQYRGSQKRSVQMRKNIREHLPRLSGKRLVCHCLPTYECHADSVISEYMLLCPEAYDIENANGAVPSSAVLRRLAQLRLERDSSEGSSPDEGAQKKGSGWKAALGGIKLCGTGESACDGQSLASPGRWAVDDRRYPEDSIMSQVPKRYMTYSEKVGTPELLASLALWKVSSSLSSGRNWRIETGSNQLLSDQRFITGASSRGSKRYLSLLLQAAQDPEVSLEEFSRGVRVGPGVRLP